MLEECQRMDDRVILSNKQKILLVHSSSPYKHSLKDVLEDPTISRQIEDTKAVQETKILNTFFEMLNNDEDKAMYGITHVEVAFENGAIDTLLISDSLFRSNDIGVRKKYSEMVDRVKQNGGKVYIFSSMHVTGERLTQLGGIAAICRYRMTIEENIDSDDSDDG